ncbi:MULTISPECIES: amidase family protein [unclassified Acinetobacter]|uniref:amidase family protein n=1 Tax=unclassified Acinetobacter TaxID=196816 RepID=UPI001F4412AE|nr:MULTISPECIES: amidase [unclassified Acinetobacter]UIJ77496.1 amidase [Acinetobacter sp. SH20PTE14]
MSFKDSLQLFEEQFFNLFHSLLIHILNHRFSNLFQYIQINSIWRILMNHDQWICKSISELLDVIEKNEVDLETIIDSFYSRIEQSDPDIQAWQFLISKKEYLNQYYSNEEFYKNSVLKGLPFAVKDVIDTAGIETRMGSKIHNNRVPNMDAAVVIAIKKAGGILMGKTVTTEFAFFKSGKTKNPHDPKRTPGGSSSGSAAAVAAHMTPFALGTQTAASVIRPAAYCGCMAYVASHSEFSLRNIQPLAQSLDSLGMFANDFSDLLLMRRIIQLRSDLDSKQMAKENLRVGVYSGDQLGEIEPEMQYAMKGFMSSVQRESITFVQLPEDIDIKALADHHYKIMAFEVARNLQYEFHTGLMDEYITELIHTGLNMAHADYLEHLQSVEKIKTDYVNWMNKASIDLTIAPAAPGIAPLGLEKTGQPFMSRPWQVMGLPVTTFPMAHQQNMPLGIQLVGKFHQDDELLEHSDYLFKLSQSKG